MKLLLVLACLLLCGCSQEVPETETDVPIGNAIIAETEPVSMYDAENPLEAEYQGALKVYPLSLRKVRGIRPTENGLLVFSGYGSTTLTLLTGNELIVTASVTLDFELDANCPSLQFHNGAISFYDPQKQETVILSQMLKEISRISIKDPVVGSPILSSNRRTLYYCTSDAIRAWDLETGIHRTLKELFYNTQELIGLYWKDMVLQCRILDGENVQTIFLSTENGQQLSRQDGDVLLYTDGADYYASLPVDSLNLLVYGHADDVPQVLYPQDLAAENFYLPYKHALVTASLAAEDHMELNYYELTTGMRWASLTLEALQTPKSVVSSSDGSVFILAYNPATDCDIIYRWIITGTAEDNKVYAETFSPNGIENTAMVQCQSYAAQLSEKYGIEILIWKDALAVQPWDYEFEAETLPQVLAQELQLLDQRLGQYPKTVLEKTASHFTSLKICLVRQITGTAASGSLDTATGIQFLDGSDAYVVITVGKYSQQALYHELFHVMETHILNESAALDQWEELNPADFAYTYGYGSPENADAYLSGENQAFVDSYSMSYPKEDRARILENAMLPGNDALFASDTMQAKLEAVCQAIRQAYGLRKSAESFLWEQYLNKSLAY